MMHKKSAFILLFSVAVLISIGLVMLFSAGAFASDGHGDQFSFLRKQGFWLGFGFVVAVICATVDYRWWQRGWMVLIGASYVLLALCFVRPIGLRLNGSFRWVHLGELTVQPSELAKFAVVVFVAWWFAKFESEQNRIVKGLLIPFAVVGGILLLIVGETDLGSTALIGATALLMMFVAGVNLRLLLPTLAAGLIGVMAIAWSIPGRHNRLLAFIHPEQYQTTEAQQQFMGLIALGSGGIDGLGLGNGRQKMFYLEYAYADFIFPVIGEELGLRVTLVIVFCYLLILTSGTLISLNARDRFGMLFGFGCTSLLGLQALINVGVTTSMLPNKGSPLPFISYGGSNLFFCLVCVGVLINIYRHGKEEAPATRTEMMVRVRHLSKF
jgi:cell division protein FtsW